MNLSFLAHVALAIPQLEGVAVVGRWTGAKRTGRIGKAAVYEWLKDEDFKHEYGCQREQLTAVALETAKASIVKATVTLVRHFDS